MEMHCPSNLAHWISCFPRYASFFSDTRNIAFFTANSPPMGEEKVNSEEWKQITSSLSANNQE